MKPKISLITLGVHDLKRAIQFYRDGLELPEHETDSDEVAFFKMEGAWLSLFSRASLASDIGITDDSKDGFSGITLAHNVASQEAVEQVLQQAIAAGAELIKPAEEVFWGGYSGYFRDPEGHYWEVAYNPFMDLT
ncbi:VOC family protein [Halomonas sp. AOP27-A1-41]|uniref:VOC family protein n=1 Tax=Halomonas sp. AOP27-A1-41 TaxID=3457707 RepID=UPI004034C95E